MKLAHQNDFEELLREARSDPIAECSFLAASDQAALIIGIGTKNMLPEEAERIYVKS